MIKYPITCTTYAAKAAFVERLIALLHAEHNVMGKWFNKDKPTITLEEYNQLGLPVRLQYPFGTVDKLSKAQWEAYTTGRFDIKLKRLIYERGLLKNFLYASTRFSPNLDDDIT